MSLTEQKRVQLAVSMLSAYKFVVKSPTRELKWTKSATPVSSGEIADLLDIPVEVVEAAVRNIGEQVSV